MYQNQDQTNRDSPSYIDKVICILENIDKDNSLTMYNKYTNISSSNSIFNSNDIDPLNINKYTTIQNKLDTDALNNESGLLFNEHLREKTIEGINEHRNNSEESENNKKKEQKRNRMICEMINLHLNEFFDDIYIPFDFFKENDWKIRKVLYDNEDALFYHSKYLINDDENRFYEIFDKYVSMIEEILSPTPNNKLYIYLKKWSSGYNNEFLKSLILDDYQVISPLYTTNLYCKYRHKYDDAHKLRNKIQHHLDKIIKSMKKEIKTFKHQYFRIVDRYVAEFPIDGDNTSYISGFINSVILEILNLAEKLINLHIYAIHPIISEIVNHYFPLDRITESDSKQSRKRICII